MTTITQPTDLVEQLDVDALRKTMTRHLLDLADEHNLPWPNSPSAVRFIDPTDGAEKLTLRLWLDNDLPAGVAAWAEILGLAVQPVTSGSRTSEPHYYHRAQSYSVPGWFLVEVSSFQYPARGLPEQGPRPESVTAILAKAAALAAEAAQVVAAVLTPDDPALPVETEQRPTDPRYGDEYSDYVAAEPVAPRSWSAGQTIDADVDEVAEVDVYPEDESGTWRRTAEGGWRWHSGNGRRGIELPEAEMLARYGDVTEVIRTDEQSAEVSA